MEGEGKKRDQERGGECFDINLYLVLLVLQIVYCIYEGCAK